MVKRPGTISDGQGGSHPLKPTVIAPPKRNPARGDEQREDRRDLQPRTLAATAVPGTRRQRLEVTAADLAKMWPLASKSVIRRAVNILQSVVVDSASERSAILFGHELQEQYGRSVSLMLALSHDPVMIKTAGYVNRMSSILASIDLKAIAGAAPGVGQYLKRLNQRIDTPEELQQARLELDQLVGLMAATVKPLLALKVEIERQAKSTEEMAEEIEAMALAAEYLAGIVSPKKPDVARIYADRATSLTRTLAQIHETSTLRTAQAGQPLTLIASVQDIALVTVPGWLSSLSAMTATMQNQRRPTPTETGELDHRLRTILQQLKS